MAESSRFFSDTFGAIVPRFTGGASCFCSTLIIYLISRSPAKFRTTYHRLMLGMSLFDMWSSSSIFLGTWLLPDMPDDWNPESWNKIGNISSCRYQGFSYTCGTLGSSIYIISICLYYVCSMALKLSKEQIKLRIEWFLHFLPFSVSWVFSILILELDMFNSHYYLPYCTITCGWPNIDCDESDRAELTNLLQKLVLAAFLFVFLGVLLILLILCLYAFISLRNFQKLSSERSEYYHTELMSRKQTAKVTLLHSLFYVLDFIITYFPAAFNAKGFEPFHNKQIQRSLPLIFSPLQGFWNLIIFIWGKAYSYNLVNTESSWGSAIKAVLLSRNQIDDEAIIFLNLSFLQNENECPSTIFHSIKGCNRAKFQVPPGGSAQDDLADENISYPTKEYNSGDDGDISYNVSFPSSVLEDNKANYDDLQIKNYYRELYHVGDHLEDYKPNDDELVTPRSIKNSFQDLYHSGKNHQHENNQIPSQITKHFHSKGADLSRNYDSASYSEQDPSEAIFDSTKISDLKREFEDFGIYLTGVPDNKPEDNII